MNFIQTGFLIGGLAVAIPVLVHLLSRWQVRRVELGTMRFLQEVMQDGAQRRKIRRWLLLLTRMATVAVLVLLFARPYLPETIRRDGDRLRVMLIDRSASMSMPGQGGRLIDDAVAEARDVAAELGTDATVLWAWFDSSVEPFDGNLARVSAPRSVVGDTNYLAALRWARDRVAADSDVVADVVILSDLQQSGLASDALETATLKMPKQLPVRVIDVGRPAANNLAIQTVTTTSKRLSPQRDALINATLFNFGTLPMEEIPMTATATNGRRSVRLKKSINLPDGQAQELSFDFGKLDPGTWQVTVQLDVEDDLAVDNRRMTAFEIAQPAPVLVLDGGSRDGVQLAESFYLAAALRQTRHKAEANVDADRPGDDGQVEPPPSGLFDPQVVYLHDDALPEIQPGRTGLVVVTDCRSLPERWIQRLESYVTAGGKLLVFAGDGNSDGSGDAAAASHAAWQQSGLAPGTIQTPTRSGAMPFRITSIESANSMLSPFADPQSGDLGRLSFDQILPIRPAEQTDVLARFEGDRPALTRHRLGQGDVVWFLSSADASWGNWTTSPLYLPLVHQMAADLLDLTGEGKIRYRSVGDRRDLSTTRPAQRASPDPAELRTVSAGSVDTASLTFGRIGFEQSGGALYVINATAKESDPTRIPVEQFTEHFQITPADSGASEVAETVQGEHKHELWPWFAAAAVVLLTAEFSLANRTSA
ncbi:BatA domain-containing protein [Stieleria sp. ICT_E10.1]|uniref:vWA domain-containing protein n=1 Tax=Stieleria sedimenti TaxID=2976331 RepID=UPI00217FD6D4|nr:BatA and WFA domain-containing protein [Stieleria sedimenti]MCS7467692.1 BatA domain-containing protein [Stieleria sedimenti]